MKVLTAEFFISAVRPEQFPKDSKPQIAFAGRSNVGKSSLINSLVHRKSLVKTSATPGKTQLINFFNINNSMYFVDLPGYGYARAPQAVVDAWAPMVEGYLKESPQLAGVVVLMDIRREPDHRDFRLFEWLKEYSLPAVYVLTKSDKLNRQQMEQARREIGSRAAGEAPLLVTSAKSGQGIKELWVEIGKLIKP